MAKELHDAIIEADAEKYIASEAGDTCAPVTGEHGGMFSLLENLLGHPLLKSWCRSLSRSLHKSCVQNDRSRGGRPQDMESACSSSHQSIRF